MDTLTVEELGQACTLTEGRARRAGVGLVERRSVV